jgi:hypothetical protein
MTTIIELKRLADLPTGRGMLSTTSCKTPQEAQTWAAQLGADEVYTYRQSNGVMLAWVMKGETK